jgi:hypothetical protein
VPSGRFPAEVAAWAHPRAGLGRDLVRAGVLCRLWCDGRNGLREKGEKERGSRSSLVEGLAETSEHTASGASGRP